MSVAVRLVATRGAPITSTRLREALQSTRELAVAFAAACLLAACDRMPEPPAAPTAAGDAALEEGLEIERIGAAEFAELLEENRGNVVLVNLWATWCVPCLREIPELLRLERRYAPEGVRVLGISLDEPGDFDEVVAFRDRFFADFRTFHSREDDWFELVGVVTPEWNAILPTSFVIDRRGALVTTLTGGQDYDRFEAAVKPLL
jgi:thiol-disulfide isomerase/thioredoxin